MNAPLPELSLDAPTGTRAALIGAGLHCFGIKGFAATSTRELAAKAQTNVASIAYHFASKDGLYAACAVEVARRLTTVAGAPRDHFDLTAGEAQARLESLIHDMTRFLLNERDAGDVVAFMLHAVTARSGTAIDLLYERLLEPKHRELCQLWSRATGQAAETPQTRLAVFAAIGQVVYFRIGLPVIARRMEWTAVGPDEAGAIAETVLSNLRAALERSRMT